VEEGQGLVRAEPERLHAPLRSVKWRHLRGSGSPLHFAVRRNLIDVAQALIELGADVNGRDGDERTPLHFVRTPEMVSVLVGAGAAGAVGYPPARGRPRGRPEGTAALG